MHSLLIAHLSISIIVHFLLFKEFIIDSKASLNDRKLLSFVLEYFTIFWFPLINLFSLFFILHELHHRYQLRREKKLLRKKFPSYVAYDDLYELLNCFRQEQSSFPFKTHIEYRNWCNDTMGILRFLNDRHSDNEYAPLLLFHGQRFARLMELNEQIQNNKDLRIGFLHIYKDAIDSFVEEFYAVCHKRSV